MALGGFAGNILYINLTDGQVRKEEIDADQARKFIGGLGLCVKLAADRMAPGVDALSPANPVVIGAGPFVGTNLPASSRVYAVTRLPASGTVGWCGGGGATFGYLLKNAGYDHIVIEGQSDHPVYIKIRDDEVEIRDAGPLWGKNIDDTCAELWREHGSPGGIIAIGQAGENRVSFAMAYIDRLSSMGRGGFGAVLGAKKLKAVFVQGSRGVRVADEKRYRKLSGDIFKSVRNFPYLKEWQELGLVKSFPFVPTDLYLEMRKRRVACVSCPIGDKEIIDVGGGRVKYSSSVVNLFMPTEMGMADYREAIECVSLLDDYGLDMFEFFGLLGFVRELVEQGVIPRKRLDEEINLASLASMQEWAGRISRREGLGAVLANGFAGVIREFGPEAEKAAPYVIKGMYAYVGPKAPVVWNLFGTMELGQVLDPRGPHVAASGSPTYFAKRPLSKFPAHLVRMGVSEEALARILINPGAPEEEQDLKVGRLLKYSHRWFATLGSLGVCARAAVNRFYNAELCAGLYSAVTGLEVDKQELLQGADRAWTLLRLVNAREGFTRKDDAFPPGWFEEPAFKNYLTGQPVSREEVERMLEDYYDEQGWDVKTGLPNGPRLKELDLDLLAPL